MPVLAKSPVQAVPVIQADLTILLSYMEGEIKHSQWAHLQLIGEEKGELTEASTEELIHHRLVCYWNAKYAYASINLHPNIFSPRQLHAFEKAASLFFSIEAVLPENVKDPTDHGLALLECLDALTARFDQTYNLHTEVVNLRNIQSQDEILFKERL